MLGFAPFNKPAATLFLGDVGSLPIGLLVAWLLYKLALAGALAAAVLLPLYYLADATITLLRRLFRGERVWRPHREHFYQRAVQRGLSHAEVTGRVIAADLVLIGCGWTAENGWGIVGLAVAAATVLVLLASLAGRSRRKAA